MTNVAMSEFLLNFILIFTCSDKTDTLVTAITSKSSVQLIDIVSTRMLGQYGFLAEVRTCICVCTCTYTRARTIC